MSGSHGGPRHSIEPNKRQHDAGDRHQRATPQQLVDAELRDQADPLERARRLADYHARSGRCLYAQSAPARILDAPRSSIAAAASATPASNVSTSATPIAIADPARHEVMVTDGDVSVQRFSAQTPFVGTAGTPSASPLPPSSTTSSRTAATNGSSGIDPTGSRCVHRVTRARRQLKTAALETHATPLRRKTSELLEYLAEALRDDAFQILNLSQFNPTPAVDVECTALAGYLVEHAGEHASRLANGSYTFVVTVNGGARDTGVDAQRDACCSCCPIAMPQS